jgi:hypothetical protein
MDPSDPTSPSPCRLGRAAARSRPSRKTWPQRLRAAWNGGVPAVLLLAAWMLNPDEGQHRDTLRAAVEAGHPVSAGFAAHERAAPPVRYQSLVVCSVTQHRQGLTTLGAFGHVVPFGKRRHGAAAASSAAP